MQKNTNSKDFFPGKFSLDRMVNNGGSQKKSQTPSLFSQSSQLTFGQSSYESSGTPNSKSTYRYDEMVSINRHKDIMDGLTAINTSILKLNETISRQTGALKIDFENSFGTVVEELQTNAAQCKSNCLLSKELVDGLVKVKAALMNSELPPTIISSRSPSPSFSDTDKSSDSDDDGVSLSQYLNNKTKSSIQAVAAPVGRDFKPNYVKPTITSSATPAPTSHPPSKSVVVPKRDRDTPVVVSEPPLASKRVRTLSSKMNNAREESLGMSFLFDSFTLDQKAQPAAVAVANKSYGKAAPQKVVQKPPLKSGTNLKAVPVRAAPLLVAPAAKRVEDSQLTQLSAESYSYQSGDDEDDGSTTSCVTFTDDNSYLTEPLFYR